MGLYILITLQIITVFLINLNELLLGASKEKIRFLLVGINLFFIFLSFIIYGWLTGGIYIIGTIIWAILSTPLANFVSFKILRFRAPTQTVDRDLNKLLTGKTSIEEYFEKSQKSKERNHEKMDRVLEDNKIQNVLKEFSKTSDNLEVYKILLSDIFLEIISSPKKLRILFEMENQGLTHLEISYKMRQVW